MNKFNLLAEAALAEEGIGRHLKAIGRSAVSPLAWAQGAGNVLKGLGSVAGALDGKHLQSALNKPSELANAAKEKYKDIKKWAENPDSLRDKEKWWEGDAANMENKLPKRGDIFNLIINKAAAKGRVVKKRKVGTDIVYTIITNAKGVQRVDFIISKDGRFTTTLHLDNGNAKSNVNAKFLPTGKKGYWILKV